MDLENSDGVIAKNPSEARIVSEIQMLSLRPEDEEFLILSRDEMSFIQTVRADNGFGLEYQENSLAEHYGCFQNDLDEAKVTRAFVLYAQNDNRWRSELTWEKMDL